MVGYTDDIDEESYWMFWYFSKDLTQSRSVVSLYNEKVIKQRKLILLHIGKNFTSRGEII